MENLLDCNADKNIEQYTVYMHKNKINNKVYIGQTRTTPEQRWGNGRGYKGCTLFERAIKKYGWDNFEHIIVEDNLTKEESCEMERALIALYDSTNPKNGYNISIGGDSGHTGVPISEEARKKISEANKGKVVSMETRQKMSAARSGITLSQSTIQKLRENHGNAVVQLDKHGTYIKEYFSAAEASRETGICVSTILACLDNIGNRTAGGFIWVRSSDYDDKNNNYSYTNIHFRPVVQLDKNGVYIAEFETCKEAQRAMGKMNSNAINACCRGDAKSAYGFVWIYKDEYDDTKEYIYTREPYGNQYAVIQIDLLGNVVAEFDTVQNAHRATGINYCCICECCNGTQKTAGGFVWRRKTEQENSSITPQNDYETIKEREEVDRDVD